MSNVEVEHEFKKATPPVSGDAYGSWANRDLSYLSLPGGSVLQFDLSRLTLADFRQMRDHYQVGSTLSILNFQLFNTDWHIEGPDRKRAQQIEDNIRARWAQLNRGRSTAHWAGFSPMVLDWDNNVADLSVEIGRVKDLAPEECRVRWKKVQGYKPPNRPAHIISKYDGIVQVSPGGGEIPVEHTLWYPLLMEHGDYYGRKLLRAAFAPYFFSMLLHLFSNRYFERFGEPTPIGRADFEDELEIDGQIYNGRDAMLMILENLRNRGVVVLPNERRQIGADSNRSEYAYDISFLESQMRGADFERYMSRLDEEISLSIFTPQLLFRTADVGGSNNLGLTHTQTYLMSINALNGDFKEYLDNYVIRPLRDYNWGPNAGRYEWKPRPLGKDNVETVRAIVTEMLRAGKVKADLLELGQAIGLTLEEIREVAPEIAPPAVDSRIGRPERMGVARGVSNRIAARLEKQATRYFAANSSPAGFQPDPGHRAKMNEALGDEGAEAFFALLDGTISALGEMTTPMTADEYVGCMKGALDRGLELVV